MKTIRVTGKGQIKVKPDMTRITLSLEGIESSYSATLRRSSQETETLKDILSPFGFTRADLKTLYFNVNTEYVNVREKDTYQKQFAGYKFQHTMKVEFESDNDRLGKILYALANCSVNPNFKISYTVQDPEGTKNLLLGKAVADAKAKAVVLTQAAGVRLKEIQNIDYSWGEIDFEVRPVERMLMTDDALDMPKACYDLDIEPDDIEVSDTVTVIWEIDG